MKKEREKSDPSKVAKRPANKPKVSKVDLWGGWAEPVEPRGGTEGNTGKQHTYRTPSRASVSQGLERVREAARKRKKERFTALLHHVTIDLLKDAYSWLKREAAPGVDGQTWQSYLHYVFDLRADRWRKRHARGRVIIVRFADDIIIGFEHEGEARRFLADMRQRMEKFALSLHPDKTRLIEFGRYAAEHRARRGLGKPETFNFLGFTHICGRSSRGIFQLKRQTRRDRMRARLRAIKEELQRRMHEPIPLQGKWLRQVVRGYFTYHAVPTNSKNGSLNLQESSCLYPESFILGRAHASPSNTQGGSPVRESRTPGSVRGVLSNEHPYRDSQL